jgi:hypothetical protein
VDGERVLRVWVERDALHAGVEDGRNA